MKFTYEDEEGLSPLEFPATLEFEVDYSIIDGEDAVYYCGGLACPPSPPTLKLRSFTLTKLVSGDRVMENFGDLTQVAMNKWALDRFVDDIRLQEEIARFENYPTRSRRY